MPMRVETGSAPAWRRSSELRSSKRCITITTTPGAKSTRATSCGLRKGATPAFPGQRGFVGGTMGEQSVILEGVENEHARYSLYSTVHGAGRALGRREATGVVDRKTGEVKRAGKVTPEMMRTWVDRAGIELRGAGLDESPDCYKRLDEVLEAVGDTVRILHRLTPVGVAMAGANEFDPYKD